MRPLFLIFIVRGTGIKLLESLIIITCLESVAAGGGVSGNDVERERKEGGRASREVSR